MAVLKPLSFDGAKTHERAQQIHSEILDVIYNHEGYILIPTVIGILELVKQELIEDSRD